MNKRVANLTKETARQEYASALEWTRANPSHTTSHTPERRAANMAADAVMYKTGMHEYAEFQSHIGNVDVATWLLSQ